MDPYGQSFFPKCVSVWNGLAQEIAEANTLDLFKSNLAHQTPRLSISNHICERILLITEPEPGFYATALKIIDYYVTTS